MIALQHLSVPWRDGLQYLVGELPSDHGAKLPYVFRKIQMINTRHERILQRWRNCDRRQWTRQLVVIFALPENAGLKDTFGHFFNEKWHAIGRAAQVLHHLVREMFSACVPCHHLGGIVMR